MQPHDPSHSEFPDDIAREEHDAVSTEFDSDTGRRLKRGVVLAAVILLVGFVAVRAVRYFHERGVAKAGEIAYGAPPPVDVVVARPVSVGQDLVLPGQTAAWFESTIYARVNGYVSKWLVDIGDHVAKGQVLAIIETPELDAELNAARAQLNASVAQVAARKAEAEFAKTTNERWRDSPKGVVSEQERDAKKSDYESAEARLYAANAQVALDKARVEQYSSLAEFKQVKAPFDGTITERKIDIGNLVTAGSSGDTTLLYRMAQDDPIRIFVDVPQSAAPDLMKIGIPAKILIGAASSPSISGAITRTSDAIDPRARTFRAELDIPNPDGRLVSGEYVQVAFDLQNNGMSQVPAAALVFATSGPRVAVVGPDGTVKFQPVTIGRDDGNEVELSSGVTDGERLVLNISNQIVAGQKVQVSTNEPSGSSVAMSPLR